MSEIPKELEHLIPKPKQILIGMDVVDINPLTLDKWQIILGDVKEALAGMFSTEFLNALTNPESGADINNLMASKFVDLIRDNLSKILSVALEKEEDYVTKNITTEQMAYAVKVLYEMNLKQPVVDIRGLIDSVTAMSQDMLSGMQIPPTTPPVTPEPPPTVETTSSAPHE